MITNIFHSVEGSHYEALASENPPPPSSRQPSPWPSTSSSESKKSATSIEKIISLWLKKQRYVKRKDTLKTQAQKALAICHIRLRLISRPNDWEKFKGKALDILSMTEYKNISKDNLKSQERSLTRLIRLISENNFEEFLQGKNKKYRLKFNFYLQKLPSKQYRRKSKRISKRNSRK